MHGIFLLLPTLDLWGLPSNLLSYLPSVASPSSPSPLSAEQPLLPGERWHLHEKWGTGPGLEQCRCWGVACTDWRWRWAAPPTPACQLICTGDPPCSRRRFELVGGDLCCSRPRHLPRDGAGLLNQNHIFAYSAYFPHSVYSAYSSYYAIRKHLKSFDIILRTTELPS